MSFTRNLILFSVLFLSLTSHVFAQDNLTNTICQDNFGNLMIRDAFKLNEHIYFITDKNELIRIDGLKWDPNQKRLHTSSVAKMNTSSLISLTRATFAVNYPNVGLRAMYFFKSTDDSITILNGMMLESEESTGLVLGYNATGINLQIYNYEPNTEAMNLQSLLIKLPQEGIYDNLNAIGNFPLNPPTNTSERLFVYYIETPGKAFEATCPGCYSSYRYIFMAEKKTYGEVKDEWNWRIDPLSQSKCKNLTELKVDAALPIDDYDSEGKFHLMEIFGKQYRIYRFQVVNNEVKEPEFVVTKYIGDIFGCKKDPNLPEPTESPPLSSTTTKTVTQPGPDGKVTEKPGPDKPGPDKPGPDKPGPDKPGDTKPSEGFNWWWILLVFAIIVIIGVIGTIAYMLMKPGERHPNEEENVQMASVQPTNPDLPSQTSTESTQPPQVAEQQPVEGQGNQEAVNQSNGQMNENEEQPAPDNAEPNIDQITKL